MNKGDTKMITDKEKAQLKELQWMVAEQGNVQMLIWLGKQYLGQSDKPEIKEERMFDSVVFIDDDGKETEGIRL